MRQYIKSIIFTKTPLTRKFKYEDLFQIYPLNLANAPNSKLTDHFPMTIEFWYETDSLPKINGFDSDQVNNLFAKTTAQINRLIEITNLLSSISNYKFFFYRRPETFWSVPIPEENIDEFNNTSSIWSMSLYRFPNIGEKLKIDGFTEVDFDDVELIPQRNYYWFNPVESKAKNIDFPDTINDILARYFEIEESKKIVMLSSIYQICNGLELFHHMKSLSFFSFVSAIETLVNYEFRNEKIEYECNECKSLKA